jgi:uncharacterized membrane protein YhaH (DUF805 family)
MNWYLKVWKQYADFSGRARRTEFWMFQLFQMIIIAVAVILSSAMTVWFDSETPAETILLLIGLYFLATFIPTLAVTVRRLHDQNKSGWFIFMHFIPWVGGIIMLVFMVAEGTRGPNQYGPDPKNPDSEIDDIGN